MAIETVFLDAGFPNLIAPEYWKFAAHWDSAKLAFNPNHWYWSGKKQVWDWFDPKKFIVTPTLEVVDVDRDDGAFKVFPAVSNSWGRLRTAQPDAIWNPRNGSWYTYTRQAGTAPPPPPPIPPVSQTLWTQRMNDELAAIETLALNPADKAQAIDLVMQRYLGKP